MAKASVPKIGQKAPDFELPDADMKMHKLSDYRGKKTVLAFFPAAESPVCTAEMCTLRDSMDELRDYGAQVLGISVDGPFSNKFFTVNRHLNFPVLSDYDRKVISRYGIVMKNLASLKGYNAAKRSVFILDEQGKVRYRWVSDNPLVEPNYAEIKEHLKNN
ncbi:MAG: peroxiredoxin [Nitrososphaera sp.]|uniref:redoxin domain-containing protein n=1 Tax=Nitrososphaera sp. TaxID=1971748 RepID=UPI0017C84F64|nr:peroxiredoxin [Nitrososphaera sp.]NWG37790.1 peroxiredoxin [Nitrososphaera sp.]